MDEATRHLALTVNQEQAIRELKRIADTLERLLKISEMSL